MHVFDYGMSRQESRTKPGTWFSTDHKCFFTQEYIKGETSWEWFLGHSDDENIDFFLRLVQFIETTMHARKLAHCDLDFENILVVENSPVLLDFGVAKSEGAERITREGAQFGRPNADPKQLANAVERGYHSDIFALGRMFFSVLTRRLPNFDILLCGYDEKGKMIIDDEFVSNVESLYPESLLREPYLSFYKKAISAGTGGYSSITEFREDLESLYDGMKYATTTECKKVCRELLYLYRILGLYFEEKE